MLKGYSFGIFDRGEGIGFSRILILIQIDGRVHTHLAIDRPMARQSSLVYINKYREES